MRKRVHIQGIWHEKSLHELRNAHTDHTALHADQPQQQVTAAERKLVDRTTRLCMQDKDKLQKIMSPGMFI